MKKSISFYDKQIERLVEIFAFPNILIAVFVIIFYRLIEMMPFLAGIPVIIFIGFDEFFINSFNYIVTSKFFLPYLLVTVLFPAIVSLIFNILYRKRRNWHFIHLKNYPEVDLYEWCEKNCKSFYEIILDSEYIEINSLRFKSKEDALLFKMKFNC